MRPQTVRQRRRRARRGPLLVAAVASSALVAWSATGAAQVTAGGSSGSSSRQPGVCQAADPQPALQYLRRLSLDLRGYLPSYAELAQVVKARRVPAALIAKMIASEDLVRQLRRYHLDLLWTRLGPLKLTSNSWRLRPTKRKGGVLWLRSGGRARRYRGGRVACLDEPARFQGSKILTKVDSNGYKREGYVMVRPYWAPKTKVKVCAFDAQTRRYVKQSGKTYDCSHQLHARCGCGPNLRWCQAQMLGAGALSTEEIIVASMEEQMLRFIDDIVRNNRPYTDIFLGRSLQIDGPLAHYLRYQSRTGGKKLYARPQQGFSIPQLDFSQRSFKRVEAGSVHAGVLTMAGYLVKFQSNRGRANRFYNAFVCRTFEAPSGGIPEGSNKCHEEPDLTKRCGCKYCHMKVEPLAAYWGRWAEAGLAPLDEKSFPDYRASCLGKDKKSLVCKLLYKTEAKHADEKKYLGKLKSLVFADKQRKDNISAGPLALANKTIASGGFARCTVRKLWAWLLGDPPNRRHDKEIDALAKSFASGGYDLRKLVEAIVKTDAYKLGSLHGQGSGA